VAYAILGFANIVITTAKPAVTPAIKSTVERSA